VSPRRPDGRPLTFTEQARRAQLIAVTIELIAAHGYGQCSLQRIADAAGITKAAVLYHFPSRNAVVRAAYDTVITALTERMSTAIEAAPTAGAAVDAYVTTQIEHLRENPAHVRVIIEAIDANAVRAGEHVPHAEGRWAPLAGLIERAVAAGEVRAGSDPKLLALIVAGSIDAVIAESLTDPGFDLRQAGEGILTVLHRAAFT
jgi:AcrR family transcriptional regulator